MSVNMFTCYTKTNTVLFKHIIEMMAQISSVDNGNISTKQIKQLFFKVSKGGVEFFTDPMKIVNCTVKTFVAFFDDYFYDESDEPDLCVGVSLDVLKTCFKNVHKNDDMKITINRDYYSNFPDTINFNLNNSKGFSIKFNIVQNIDNNDTNNFVHLLNITTERFSNLYREIGGVKRKVNFTVDNGILMMKSTMVDIAENWVKMEIVEENKDFKCDNLCIKSEYFKIASKISNFGSNIKLNLDSKKNIMLESNVLNLKTDNDKILGNINIIIKYVD